MLTFIGGVSVALAESGTLEITVDELISKQGTVRCALYRSPINFLEQEYMATAVEINNMQGHCAFSSLRYGYYAVAVLHDENNSGDMDYNFIGIPKESYGFSRNPTIFLSAPTFEVTKLRINKALTKITIHVE